IGKRVKVSGFLDLQVAALVEDAPGNTHLPYSILISYPSLTPHFIGDMPLNQWGVTANGYVYIGLPNADAVRRVEASLKPIVDRNVNTDAQQKGTKVTYRLQPVADIHYDQDYAASNPSYTINYSYLYLIGAIGLFLVLAAGINYTNLSTALAIKKAKEVGVRKTMGATRTQLMRQFFSETFLM